VVNDIDIDIDIVQAFMNGMHSRLSLSLSVISVDKLLNGSILSHVRLVPLDVVRFSGDHTSPVWLCAEPWQTDRDSVIAKAQIPLCRLPRDDP